MIYQQITREERYTIAAYRVQGLSVSRSAELIDRHRSTIYREIERNARIKTDGSYRPSKTDDRASHDFKTITADNCTEFHQ